MRIPHQDTFSVGAVTLASRAASLLAVVALARIVPANVLGDIIAMLALLGLASLVADFGTSERLVQLHGLTHASAHRGLRARLTLSLCAGTAVLAAGALFVGRVGWLTLIGAPAALLLLAVALNSAILDRTEGRAARAAVWSNATATAPLIGAAIACAFAPTLQASAIGVLSTLALVAVAAGFRRPTPLLPALPGEAVRVAWDARHLAVTAISVAIYSRGDRLVLAAVSGSVSVGAYAAYYTLVFGFSILGTALAWTSMPILSRLRSDFWRTEFVKRSRFAYVGGGGLAVAFFLSSNIAVRLLFGEEYLLSRSASLAFSLLIFLYVVNPLLSSALISKGQQALVARIALLNAMIALIAFPTAAYAYGATGMAWASALIEMIGFGLQRGRVARFVGSG